jgi:uncharacterized membrane protein YdjX (TVP38/TMEM64 family)
MVSITTGNEQTAVRSSARAGWARALIVGAMFATVGAALWFSLPDKLSLGELRAQRGVLQGLVHAHPLGSVFAYLVLYTLVVALSIPGALVMTLAGGLLFGAVEGGAAAVAAVTAGSVLMYLAAHTAVGESLRLWIVERSPMLRRLEGDVRRHPFTTTLTLRLIPAAPICLVNLAAGFVRMPLLPYALATVIGVVPSTFLYASVGAGLDTLFATVEPGSLMSIIRSELALPALGLLGLAGFPLAVRWWAGRRVAQRHAVQ